MSYSRNSGIGWLEYHLTPNVFQSGTPMMTKSLSSDIQSGFMSMGYAMRDVQNAINNMHNALQYSLAEGFSGVVNTINRWGVVLAIEQYALLEQTIQINKQLSKISQQLAAIHHTLQTPHQTKVIEFRNIGLERLERGLFAEALESFKEAEKLDHTDFITTYNEGKIYFYGDGSSGDLIDLEQAGKYFKDTMKYLSAEINFVKRHNSKSKDFKQLNSLFATFLSHFSRYYYVLGNEEYLKNNKVSNEISKQNYENMLQYATLSNEVSPSGEAKFMIVKALLIMQDINKAIAKTKTLLTHNFEYLYKLRTDEDCKEILPYLDKIILEIHPTESRNLAMQSYVLMDLDRKKALEAAKRAICKDISLYKRFDKPIFKSIAKQIDNCMFWETVKHLEPDMPR